MTLYFGEAYTHTVPDTADMPIPTPEDSSRAELLTDFNRELQAVAIRHDQTADHIVADYNTGMTNRYHMPDASDPDDVTLNAVLEMPKQAVTELLARSEDDVAKAIDDYSQPLWESLSDGERLTLTSLDERLPVAGAEAVRRDLEHLSPSVRDTLTMLLDAKTCEAIQVARRQDQPGLIKRVQELQKLIINPNMKRAAAILADNVVWHDAQRSMNSLAEQRPVDMAFESADQRLRATLRQASSLKVRQAMAVSFDATVWDKALADTQIYGADSIETGITLDLLASDVTRQFVSEVIGRTAQLDDDSNAKSSQGSNEAVGGVTEADLQMLDNWADQDAAKVVRQVVTVGSPHAWLLRGDPMVVRRVIDGVKELRTHNPGMSDKAIFAAYHGRTNSKTGAEEQQARGDFQILDALMGGLKGKLPF